jgi:hypothetical protein
MIQERVLYDGVSLCQNNSNKYNMYTQLQLMSVLLSDTEEVLSGNDETTHVRRFLTELKNRYFPQTSLR